MKRFLLLAAIAPLCQAQWEIGAGGGYGLYHTGTVIAPAGHAVAGVRNRFAFTFFAGEDLYEHLSGEFRYTYQDGDPFLSSAGVKSNIQGQSHAFHYDLLFHLRPRRERFRPYFSIGAGAKEYVVSGPAPALQPLAPIALLTANDQTKVLTVAGGGIKWRAGNHVVLRLDFRDYITTFPRDLIRPAGGATARGIFHQFTPLVGVGYTF
jgi:hypothetical protein